MRTMTTSFCQADAERANVAGCVGAPTYGYSAPEFLHEVDGDKVVYPP